MNLPERRRFREQRKYKVVYSKARQIESTPYLGERQHALLTQVALVHHFILHLQLLLLFEIMLRVKYFIYLVALL